MTTLPPERLPRDERRPHQAREMAESFGSDPGRYDRARPRYPDAMMERIVATSPGPDVLDVGIGTGIAARQFQARGCRVLGVEVDARMAEWTRQRGFAVDVAAFEEWDPKGRMFDAVVAGQAWHWIDPVAGAAKAAEVLRPGGRLAAFWNVFRPAQDIAEAFTEVYRQVLPDSIATRAWSAGTDGYTQLCARAADGIREAEAFADPEEWRFDWERTYTRDEWLDQIPTSGYAAKLPPAKLDEVTAATGVAIDALGGSLTMGYTALVVTSARSRSTTTNE